MSAFSLDGVPEPQGSADSFVAEVAASIADYDKAVLFREAVAVAVADMAAVVADMATFQPPATD